MADSSVHFDVTEEDYAKGETYKHSPWPINVGDTAYVHIRAGVRAVRITFVEKRPDGRFLLRFENQTCP